MLDVSLFTIQGDVVRLDHLDQLDILDRLDDLVYLDQLHMFCVVGVIIFLNYKIYGFSGFQQE